MISDQLRSALAACAVISPLVVACDYDGTLSPLVADPSQAVPHQSALEALVRLGGMNGVEAVIISGRSLQALRTLTGQPQSVTLVGTHGAESDAEASASSTNETTALVDDLRAIASDHPGSLLEEKTVGAAVHYRHVPDPTTLKAGVRATAARHGARVIDGKLVLEVLLTDADKGSALASMRQRIGALAMVFIGDDTTDEDVFVTMGSNDVGIKVGAGATAASHRVADPGEVAEALLTLADFRQAVPA